MTVTGGRVTGLELSDLGLSGSLPAALGSLSGLVTLDLSWSGLSGEVPAALGSLGSLEVLRLNNNSLTGEVPAALGSLGSLRVLEVGANNLTGGVPAALGSLSSLEELRLDANLFTGSIPAGLGSLSSLRRLDLWGNSLSGAIPAELGDLGSLETLELGANLLTGAMPAELGDLQSLVTLGAGHNMLSGAIPAELGGLGSLETLNLDHNMLSGAIPAALGSLQSLSRLSLAANDLSGPIPAELGSLASLEILNLADNDLSGPIPAALGDLASLVWLSVVNNDLSGLIPAELGAVASLRHLSLSANPLAWPPPASLSAPRAGLNVRLPAQWAPAAPAAVAAAAGVDRLTVTWDAPADSAPYTVASYALYWRPAGTTARFARNVTTTTSATINGIIGGQAYELHVTATNHTGTGPPSAAVTATPLETPCGQTTAVDQTQTSLIADCDALWALRRALTDATAVTTATGAWDDTNAISTWTGVTVTNNRVTGLDLSATGVAGPVAATVGNLTALTELDLSDNALTGDIPATLGSLTALTELDLSDNALTGDIPATLGSLTSLTELDLSFNTLTGPVPTQLGSLSSLEVLDLVANDLTGAIPTRLGSLTALTSLRVSGDGLTGAIPTQLGSLTSLTELHIGGGGLTGAIPTQLGGLTSLTSLHIGGGSLTGAIPAQLGSLTALTSLYISGSGLSGTLPPELGALTSLETLWIKSDSLTGTVPARYGGLASLDTLYLSGGALTGPVPAWLSSLASLKRLYLHNNALTGPVPADLADLTTVWLSGNDLRGHIPPQTATAAALATLDVRDNPLSWPAPANLADPPARLTALLPDTDTWVPPRPGNVTAEAADASVTVTWDHPGAGDHYLVDTYTINYRPADQTGDHTQLAAAESPAAITGLTNATEYAIFVTATNTQGTSNPSLTVAATPSATAQARTGAYSDSDDIDASAHEDAINALAGWHIFDRTDCSRNPLEFCPDSALPRWKLAVWLVRALDRRTAAPTGTGDTFSDVTKWYKPFVERLRVLGVTTGCVRRSTIFCPNDTVTRAEMAVFLVRAFNIPLAGDAGFTDIDRGYWAYDQINAIADAGITRGCTPTTFCPEANTTNAQMAAFIHRACTNTNRDCSPTDIENGSTGGGGGTTPQPQGPSAPTITNITAGPGTLTVTWQRHDDDADRTITKWQIQPHKLTYTTNNLGVTIDTATALDALDAPGGTRTQQTHTIENLEFNTRYRITIHGYYGTTPGTSSDPKDKTTDHAAVELVALEVTQGLQNWQGDVTLVKGRKTVVRVFMEPDDPDSDLTQVNVSLHLIDDDGRLLKTSRVVNPTLEVTTRQPHNFEFRQGAAGTRDSLYSSANFILDDPAWIGNPDETGAVTRRYQLITNDTVNCQDAVAPVNECEAEVTFVHVRRPSAKISRVFIYSPPIGPPIGPSHSEIDEQKDRIATIIPSPGIAFADGIDIYPHTAPGAVGGIAIPPEHVTGSPVLGNIGQHLHYQRRLDILRGRTRSANLPYLGVVRGFPRIDLVTGDTDAAGGATRLHDVDDPTVVTSTAAWYLAAAGDVGAFGGYRNTGPHEFGHVLGLPHTTYLVQNSEGEDEYRTYCTHNPEVVPADVAPFLRDYPADYTMTVNGVVYPTLGPVNLPTRAVSDDAEIWGLDTRFAEGEHADIPDTLALSRLAVINPRTTYSLMTRCPSLSPYSQVMWMDNFFLDDFITRINAIDWPAVTSGTVSSDDASARRGGSQSRGNEQPSDVEVLVVAGYRSQSQPESSGEVTLFPNTSFMMQRSGSQQATSGDHLLELLGSNGEVLRAVRFSVEAVTVHQNPSGQNTAGGVDFWFVTVEDPPSYSTMRVSRNSSVLFEQDRSPSAPQLSVTSPSADASITAETVTLAWSATDADGDALSYRVAYSTDGGATYETLAVGLREPRLEIPRSRLTSSSRARIRIMALDGTRSTTAESALFSVENNAPELRIVRPRSGSVLGGPNVLMLEATAFDREDGELGASSITWTSSLDGTLASTGSARVGLSLLSLGTHILTASATDADGASTSATVSVTVNDDNTPPTGLDDTVYGRPVSGTVVADVLANDTDIERDIDPGTLTVLVPASRGGATVQPAAVLGRPWPAVRYRPAAAGVDVLVYEVCDRLRQCTTAELVIFT